MKSFLGKALICVMLPSGLMGCHPHKLPPVLPVFEFNQWQQTVVNPASFHACGNALFPCHPQQAFIIKGDKHGTLQTIQK